MSTSFFIAKLLGPMFALLGVALLAKRQMYETILLDLISSPALTYIAGFFGLLGGLALILTHNVWALDWRLIITLIGWVTIARAIVTIFQPEQILALGKAILAHPALLSGAAAANLAIGLVLSYFGYFG